MLDIVGEIFGSPNIELFGNGQLVYKEPGGGHAVNLHQDAAFFEFGGSGLSPIGTLNYCVDTNLSLNNGPLTVFPGTHRRGFIDHVDTSSHLGLDPAVWTVDAGVTLEGRAGDSILFHQHTVRSCHPWHPCRCPERSSSCRCTDLRRTIRPTRALPSSTDVSTANPVFPLTSLLLCASLALHPLPSAHLCFAVSDMQCLLSQTQSRRTE